LSGATTSSLQVRIAAQRPAGTADAPGKNVRAKSALNKAILDQGWYEFRRQLDYKLAWKGGRLIVVPPQNTSRTCPCCGHVLSDNRQTQAWFECVACGYENHADVVGAINILSRGMQIWRDEGQDTADAAVGMRVGEPPVSARMACGSNCTGGRKQEPAETTAQGAIHA
jgi:Transposase and inactivated derivatives